MTFLMLAATLFVTAEAPLKGCPTTVTAEAPLKGRPTIIPFQAGNDRFDGVWIAQLQGRTFVRLELASANGTPTGKIGTGNLTVDKQGDVSEATGVPAQLTPMSDIVVRDSTLAFARMEGSELEHFELRLRPDGTAELEFLPSAELLREMKDEGIPAPKPIRLTRSR